MTIGEEAETVENGRGTLPKYGLLVRTNRRWRNAGLIHPARAGRWPPFDRVFPGAAVRSGFKRLRAGARQPPVIRLNPCSGSQTGKVRSKS